MDHIVICVHPFIMRQELSVFKNGECIEHKECDIKDVADVCFNLCKKHNINKVDYAGVAEYGKKIEEKMKLFKYNNFELQFNYY